MMYRRTSSESASAMLTPSPHGLLPAEVVEHRVDQYAQTTRVAGVDEPDQAVRAAVRFVHAVPQHAVVSPAVGSGERVDRHQLDEVDPEIDQIVQLFDRGVEGPLAGEGSDVQLVDHRAFHRPAGPVAVGPAVAWVPQL
jgi:hypothetical protein